MKQLYFLLILCYAFSPIKANNIDTIGSIVYLDTMVNICPGEAFWGKSLPGIYTDTVTANGICNITTLRLNIFPQTPQEEIVKCIEPNDMVTPLGRDTLIKQDLNGCDYLEITDTYRKLPDSVTDVSICEGAIFTIDTLVISQSGTYTIEIYENGPCPYNAILNVNVLNSTPDIITTQEICDGDCYEWFGQDYCGEGTYINTLIDPDGCDYNEILELIVTQSDDCRMLEVIVFEDLNDDCVYDTNEPGLKNVKVTIGDYIIKRTDEQGSSTANPRNGSYVVKAQLDKSIYELCEDSIIINLIDTGEHRIYLPVKTKLDCASVEFSGSTPLLRRCFPNTFHCYAINEGSELAEDVLVTIHMDPYFIYQSSDMELVSEVDSIYTFRMPDIPARESKRGHVNFELSCEAELGQAHYFTAKLDHLNRCDHLDTIPEVFECRENRGSYDPNDKGISIDGIADEVIIGEESKIEYLIRFQNTGTDTAFTVRIEDTISEDFNLSSLNPTASSHQYEWSVDRDRNMVITFNDINLVDSTENEKASHGFVKFEIELKDMRPEPGAVVENTAEIYFDFNDPIITNTVSSFYKCQHTESNVQVTICEGEDHEGYTIAGIYEDGFSTAEGCDSMRILELIVLEASSEDCISSTADLIAEQLVLYPIPASEFLYFRYDGPQSLDDYAIYNTEGKIIKTDLLQGDKISVADISPGLYLIKLWMTNGKSLDKRVVIAR